MFIETILLVRGVLCMGQQLHYKFYKYSSTPSTYLVQRQVKHVHRILSHVQAGSWEWYVFSVFNQNQQQRHLTRWVDLHGDGTQHMDLQTAFSQILCGVNNKSLRDTSIRYSCPQYLINGSSTFIDHRPLPSSYVGQQPRRYYRCVRERLEQVHRVIIRKRWPEAELIASLVNDGTHFHAFRKFMLNWFDRSLLILYRELYTVIVSIPVFLSAT